jgi:hypothetical protein
MYGSAPFSVQTDTASLSSTNQLRVVMVKVCVFLAARTKYLNII